ncbi:MULTISPECIES: hypothetical protein [Myroides]|uniref:Uncharacterized protein n=1 Tax=Myroides albus TaxID=2562892 RepID=A0A6I3LGH8_9FLAO|nr:MULTISPECIES: hypothetical protein [Myroides]MTG96997.1 hypothetical protein [Myroides albus]MVX34464.1 hypothetical protein [Myroides sp. LoEW2-1]UVD80512.1 hypothetical protein NWE55_04370 [Myroides albus]
MRKNTKKPMFKVIILRSIAFVLNYTEYIQHVAMRCVLQNIEDWIISYEHYVYRKKKTENRSLQPF